MVRETNRMGDHRSVGAATPKPHRLSAGNATKALTKRLSRAWLSAQSTGCTIARATSVFLFHIVGLLRSTHGARVRAAGLRSGEPRLCHPRAHSRRVRSGVTSLLAGAGCRVRVAFLPTERGLSEATLTAISESLGSVSLALRGEGLAAAEMALDPEAHDFGVVLGGAGRATLSVTNAGDLPLTERGPASRRERRRVHDRVEQLRRGHRARRQRGQRRLPRGSPRSGTIGVGDRSTNVTLTLRGVGQALPAVGSPCVDGRCAGTATCENHSNGQSLVCCGQNCTGSQRCSENQGFESCELPKAGQGQGCGHNVSCNPGLTCDPTTGTCCTAGCGGPCRFCTRTECVAPSPTGSGGVAALGRFAPAMAPLAASARAMPIARLEDSSSARRAPAPAPVARRAATTGCRTQGSTLR
jgi:hypothetical protein